MDDVQDSSFHELSPARARDRLYVTQWRLERKAIAAYNTPHDAPREAARRTGRIAVKRFAKIVCTIGPACRSRKKLQALVDAGMDVARLNFSHGTHEEHRAVFETLRRIAPGLTIMQDLSGPKIRIGELRGGKVKLHDGQLFTLTTREIAGDERGAHVAYPRLPRELSPGNDIYLADGTIHLVVESIARADVRCRVVDGGVLTSRKGLNLPGARIAGAALTEKDRRDLAFGLSLGVDAGARSFVRSAAEVGRARKIIGARGSSALLIAKIEKREALERLDAIVDAADGIMVARGDLGVEIPPEEVPEHQKAILALARERAKPVIVATQMLESMVSSERPTRAEASDVANAVMDGADALMLSAETATGQFPVESAAMMARIVERAEGYVRATGTECRGGAHPSGRGRDPGQLAEMASAGAVNMARSMRAHAIAGLTHTGRTARFVARHRYPAPVVALTNNPAVIRQAGLIWGALAIPISRLERTDEIFAAAKETLRAAGIGGRIVLAAGIPLGEKSQTNTVHLVYI
jgi:pyruvate kinase